MMEFLFCLLNHMKFYLTPYLDGMYEIYINIYINGGIKRIFYLSWNLQEIQIERN